MLAREQPHIFPVATKREKTLTKKPAYIFLEPHLMKRKKKNLWMIYNVIREVGSTFRVLKTDLDLRPIYHKTDHASMAHLHMGLLAYWLVATIRYQLKQQGFRSEWREIVRIMNTQKCITTSVTNIDKKVVTIRQCTEPTKKVKQIYDFMNYKYAPFYRKKSVVLPEGILKNDSS